MSMLNSLSEPFPSEVEKQLKKGGASLTYIPVSEVITRLNKVLGVDMWSYEIIKCERDALDPDYIVAHVRLSATFVPTEKAPNIIVTKDGIGGQKIKRTRNGDILDLGDEMKGAVSDALKKAAQHFGVGLYLARSEESMHLEYAEEQAVSPISSEHFDRLRKVLNSQTQEGIEGAKKYWATISNNADFNNQNVTGELLDKMLAWVKENKTGE
tara:strand:- start:541 stop:1176 length:636 start_codon:yes stop_codon:yes gene_type:complete